MKKQEIRRIILYVLAYSFPVLFLLLSPVIPFEGIFFGGIVVGSLIIFVALFILSLFLGRIFCGWICPGGAYQEAFCSFVNNKPVNTKRVDKIKFIIWVPWIIGITSSFIMVGGIKKIDFFFNTYFSTPLNQWGVYIIIYIIVSSIIMIISFLVGRRGFCHSTCWIAPFMILGKSIGRRLKLPSVKLRADSSKCISCKICNKQCEMSLNVMDMAKNGIIDSNECVLCGKCVAHCPKCVIKYSFGKSHNSN